MMRRFAAIVGRATCAMNSRLLDYYRIERKPTDPLPRQATANREGVKRIAGKTDAVAAAFPARSQWVGNWHYPNNSSITLP